MRPRIYFDPVRKTPSPMERSSRFVCGALAGAVVGFVVGVKLFAWSLALFILSITAGIVVCAGLAVHLGDDFWYDLRNFLIRF